MRDLVKWLVCYNLERTVKQNPQGSIYRAVSSLSDVPPCVFVVAVRSELTGAWKNGVALLERMNDKFPERAMVFVGAGDDYPDSEKAGLKWKGNKLNLCGKFTPRETAAIIQRAELFIGSEDRYQH